MPAAEQEPLAALIKAAARSYRPGHFQLPSNAKSPDVPGAADIAIRGWLVSPQLSPIIGGVLVAGLDPAVACLLMRMKRGSNPAHDELCGEKISDAPRLAQSSFRAGHEPFRRRAETGQAVS